MQRVHRPQRGRGLRPNHDARIDQKTPTQQAAQRDAGVELGEAPSDTVAKANLGYLADDYDRLSAGRSCTRSPTRSWSAR
jgi:hypothetical protein